MLTHAEQMGSGGGQPGSSGRGREAPSSGWLACGVGGGGGKGGACKVEDQDLPPQFTPQKLLAASRIPLISQVTGN